MHILLISGHHRVIISFDPYNIGLGHFCFENGGGGEEKGGIRMVP